MMALTPIRTILQDVANLASALRTDQMRAFLADDCVTKSEFADALREAASRAGGNREGNGSNSCEIADAVAPHLFHLLDRDSNGVLEGKEAEILRFFLTEPSNAIDEDSSSTEGGSTAGEVSTGTAS
jgi:hypothetical protein